jgi:hypothetical protein
VTTKLRERAGVLWPPHAPRVRTSKSDSTPGPWNFAGAKLLGVYRLSHGATSVDIQVTPRSGPDVLLAVDVLDPDLREPLARFLKKHKGRTLAELGNLDVDF